MATEGAEALTMIRVAAESGVSVGSLYRYLPNREVIIESLARHYLGLLEAEMDTLVERVRRGPVDDWSTPAWKPSPASIVHIQAFELSGSAAI